MQAFTEVAKPFVLELLRVGVIAVIPVAVISLESGNVDPQALAVVSAVAVLKALDRMLHESGVAEKGITRF